MKSPRLKLAEVGVGLSPALLDLAQKLEDDLMALPEGAAERVHGIRVRTKILRSLLRLAEKRIGEAVWQDLVQTLRSIKEAFAHCRDEEVIRGCLDEIFANGGELARRCGLREKGEISLVDEGVRRAAIHLKTSLLGLELGALERADVADAYGAAYRRGRKTMRAAVADFSDEEMHRWRKRVKEFLYQTEAVEGMPLPKKTFPRARKLAALLGDFHDLSMVRGRLNGADEDRAVCGRQKRIGRKARALGEKLFRRKPKVFCRRLKGK